MPSRSKRRLLFALGAASIAAAGCGAPTRAGGARTPSAGRIWDARAGVFVTAPVVQEAARAAPVVLLGETHDNPEHHRLQHGLLAGIVATGRRPALVMEQFDREFQEALDLEQARPGRTAETVLDAGHFNRHSWQVEGYRPLVALALEYELPIRAGNLSRKDARKIVRDPKQASLPPVARAVEEALAADIERSHCGEKPEPDILVGMIAAQRARDLWLARAIALERDRGAVLIAGAGHVRADRGVPLYLPQRPLVIAFIEADASLQRPEEYFDAQFATPASFDYLWFTQRAERADPCARVPALPGTRS